MSWLKDGYKVMYKDKQIGHYYAYDDGTFSYTSFIKDQSDTDDEIKEMKLDRDYNGKRHMKVFSQMIKDEYRVPGRKRIIYQKDDLILERCPRSIGDRFSVYRRWADEGEPDYSPVNHDAPHYEGPHTPEGMREWASWYAFEKMDDGTYEAALDEAWWWGGGHNDGGTIHAEIPEEWFELPYEEFLSNVVRLAAATHYGFTVEILLEREGLKEFFGYSDK